MHTQVSAHTLITHQAHPHTHNLPGAHTRSQLLCRLEHKHKLTGSQGHPAHPPAPAGMHAPPHTLSARAGTLGLSPPAHVRPKPPLRAHPAPRTLPRPCQRRTASARRQTPAVRAVHGPGPQRPRPSSPFSLAPRARPSSSLGLVTWVMMAGPSMGARRGGRPPARPPACRARWGAARWARGAAGRGGARRRRLLGAPAARPRARGEAARARAPVPAAAAGLERPPPRHHEPRSRARESRAPGGGGRPGAAGSRSGRGGRSERGARAGGREEGGTEEGNEGKQGGGRVGVSRPRDRPPRPPPALPASPGGRGVRGEMEAVS